MGGINGGAFSAVDEEASNFHDNDEVISSQAKVKVVRHQLLQATL